MVQLHKPLQNTMGEQKRGGQSEINLSSLDHIFRKGEWTIWTGSTGEGFMACKINVNPCVYRGAMWFSHFKELSQMTAGACGL